MKNNSALDAQNAVSAAVSLQTNGLISIFTLAKLFETISDNINSSFSEEAKKEVVRYSARYARFKCTEKHCDISTSAVDF